VWLPWRQPVGLLEQMLRVYLLVLVAMVVIVLELLLLKAL